VAPAIDRLAGEIADADPTRWPTLACELARRRVAASGDAALLEAAIMDHLVESSP